MAIQSIPNPATATATAAQNNASADANQSKPASAGQSLKPSQSKPQKNCGQSLREIFQDSVDQRPPCPGTEIRPTFPQTPEFPSPTKPRFPGDIGPVPMPTIPSPEDDPFFPEYPRIPEPEDFPCGPMIPEPEVNECPTDDWNQPQFPEIPGVPGWPQPESPTQDDKSEKPRPFCGTSYESIWPRSGQGIAPQNNTNHLQTFMKKAKS